MSDQDFFDRFRENANKMEQVPSPPTWSRIEHRIQAQRPASKQAKVRQLPRPMSIAAGLALLVGLSVMFLWLSDQQSPQALAQANLPLEMEELLIVPIENSTNNIAKEIAVDQQSLTPTRPINEGHASQRLVAKTEVQREQQQATPASRADSVRRAQEQRMGR